MADRLFTEDELAEYSALLYRVGARQGSERFSAIHQLEIFKEQKGHAAVQAMWEELCKRDSVD